MLSINIKSFSTRSITFITKKQSEYGFLTLQWDEQKQRGDTDDGWYSDTDQMIHNICKDNSFQRSDPQVMKKYNTDVESVDVIGQ